MPSLNLKSFIDQATGRIAISPVLLSRVGWTTGSYVMIQALRFGQNLILTHMLAPELFGIMVVLTSLRVGVELFTDIGIGQNVIASKKGWDPEFYNTAWSVQMLRGAVIGLIFLLLLPFVERFYDDPALGSVFPVLCVLFVLTGAHSIGPTLAVKAMDTRRIAVYDLVATTLGAVVTLAIAWMVPTIWGLIAGNIVATLIYSVCSYFVWPDITHRIVFRRDYVKEIVFFGKWVFLSSIVFFLASNFDRLVLSKYISLAALGVYGVARALGDVFGQFATRLGNAIVFPSVASADLDRGALRAKLVPHRMKFLAMALVAIGGFIAVSDVIIRLLYDPRYADAARIAPWIGLSAWLLILNTLSDSVMLGLSKPGYGAVGNVGKFVCLLVALPLLASSLGIAGASIAVVVAEGGRYFILLWAQFKERIHFLRQDIAATAAMLGLAFALRGASFAAHLGTSPLHLFTLAP